MVCIGLIGWKDRPRYRRRSTTLRRRFRLSSPSRHSSLLFRLVPWPKVINEYYKDEEAFPFAVADVMQEEYHAIVQAGFLLQIDSPDLAMGWTPRPRQTLEEFRTIIARRVEALNHALAGIPPEQVRHHICWGNGERPHHRDVELKHIIDILLHARAGARSCGRGQSSATGTSGKCSGMCRYQRA